MITQNEKFIIGLGNPGKKYINNRHNIGFILIEEFVKKHNSKLTLRSKFKSLYSEFNLEDCTYRLFMPNTYMNNSGVAVRAIIDWYKIDISQLLIIVDDIDIPLGKIRFRKKGSSGGHNGLKSIIQALNSNEFKRIRIGIGSPPKLKDEKTFNTISHVLGNFSSSEKIILKKITNKLINSVENINDMNEDSIICELNSFYNQVNNEI